MVDRTVSERFWVKVALGEGDCWVWMGATMPNGYGRFGVGSSKVVLAHRWAFEQMVAEIPAGLVIDHLCRNRACVNPAHMEPVPQGVNVRRGRAGEHFRARSLMTHCMRGHEFTPENTRVKRSGGRTCKACNRVADREKKRRLRASRKAAV